MCGKRMKLELAQANWGRHLLLTCACPSEIVSWAHMQALCIM
jgi:hypothetical protein